MLGVHCSCTSCFSMGVKKVLINLLKTYLIIQCINDKKSVYNNWKPGSNNEANEEKSIEKLKILGVANNINR